MNKLKAEPWLAQLIGEDATVPAREIKPSRYNCTGYASTDKASQAQPTEGTLEHDFLDLLRFDYRVERFVVQPFKIRWKDAAGKSHLYTPDVIVKYSYLAMIKDPCLRTTIYEVKPAELLKKELQESKPKFRGAIGWALERDCRFHFITDKQIRTPYLNNARFLMGYHNRHLPEERSVVAARQALILRTLAELKTTTPRGLLQAIATDPQYQAEILPWLWNLVVLRSVGVDLSVPLTMKSPIWSVPRGSLEYL